jgi:membrane-bound lytic murein transglycosylase D
MLFMITSLCPLTSAKPSVSNGPQSRFGLAFRLLSGIIAILLTTSCNVLPHGNQQSSTHPNDAPGLSIAYWEQNELITTSDNAFQCQGFHSPKDTEKSNTDHQHDKSLFGPPKASHDMWERLRTGFAIPVNENNPRINSQRNWYQKHPRYLKRVSDRANRYIYHIAEQVDLRQLPMELALLPVVESAYEPFAYSHGRAAGLWQFIPGTGKMYGLKIDWWYDGRRDVIASTEAALSYLSDLSRRYDGDWLLALAAYNSGQGTVSAAIRKNKKKGKKTDFWSLDLPRETQAYVPKLIALAQLIEHPEQYRITLPTLENRPYFSVIDVKSQIDLAKVADFAEVEIDEIYRLNPGFNRWATHPRGPHYLALPIENAAEVEQKIQLLAQNQKVQWERYKVTSGDSLSTIAHKFRTTQDTLMLINELKTTRIYSGKTLLVPRSTAPNSHYKLSSDQRLSKIKNRKPKAGNKTYKVQYKVKEGDSFWKIARKYKVNIRSLAKWNGLAPNDPIKPGQTLTVWQTHNTPRRDSSRNPTIRKLGYKVRNGDSLARIADKFNVRIKDIVNWNAINPKRYLQPGQRLTLYVDVTNMTN